MSDNNFKDDQEIDSSLESSLDPIMRDLDQLDETAKKSREIKIFKVNSQYNEIKQNQKKLKIFENLKVAENNLDKTKQIIRNNDEYLRAAKSKPSFFLDSSFDGKVPYIARNVVLIGAKSGQGKSTITANLAYHSVVRGQNILIISNEEMANDIYNRITCLGMGIAYADHSKFTEDQIQIFNKSILALSKKIKVIDDDYVGEMGATTSYEGIKKILIEAIDSKRYDAIIIDYYQNISESIQNPEMDQYRVQAKFADFLNNIKKKSECPIVLMMQMKDDREGKMSVKDRIEGTKRIYNVGNSMIEARIDYEKSTTDFYIAKSRFNEYNNTTVTLGYHKGKYMEYTDQFRQKVGMHKTKQKEAEMLRGIHKRSSNES